MAAYSNVVVTSQGVAGDHAVLAAADKHTAVNQLIDLLSAIVSGAKDGKLEVSAGAVRASGTIAINNTNLAADDTVSVGGVTITCKASGATGAQFNKGASSSASATNLAAALNAQAGLAGIAVASADDDTVTVDAVVPGTIGNLIALAKSEASAGAFTLSGSALSGGSNGTASTMSFGLA